MAKYKIKEKFIGNIVATSPPTYKRKDGGRFILDNNLSQKDMGYLHDVIKHDAITKDAEDEK